MATYDHIRDAYDLVYADTAEKVPFVVQKLRDYNTRDLLELGCGSGLFAIPLQQAGFAVEGLEISREMIAVAQKRDPKLRVRCGDIRDYTLGRQYDAILALSSVLVLLNDHQEIRRCLRRSYEHLRPGGLLWLELPNHPVEMRQSHLTQDVHSSDDYATIVVIQSRREELFWREDWTIFRSGAEGFERCNVTVDELLYSPDQLENDLQHTGFKIVETYGDLFGSEFEVDSSWRRVWLCQKGRV